MSILHQSEDLEYSDYSSRCDSESESETDTLIPVNDLLKYSSLL
jgi:hypothetical protein